MWVGTCSALTPAAPAPADAVRIAFATLRAAASHTALLWSHPEDLGEKMLCCQRPGRIAEDGTWFATAHFPDQAILFMLC